MWRLQNTFAPQTLLFLNLLFEFQNIDYDTAYTNTS